MDDETKQPESAASSEEGAPSVEERRRPRRSLGAVGRRVYSRLRHALFEDEEVEFDDALIRTYLANERTFLAWLRTSVVLLGVGLGAVALGGTGDLKEIVALVLGGVSAGTAIVMVFWAFVMFNITTAGIERREYRPARSLVTVAALMIIATNTIVLILLAAEILD